MIKVFEDKGSSPPKKSRRKKRSKAEQERKAKLALSKLNPMVIPLLAVHAKEGGNTFLSTSVKIIDEAPYRLTDKWIYSLNKWVDDLVAAATLDEPEISAGERIDFGPLNLIKIIPPKMDVQYPMPAMMLVDKRGWKWYFKTSKTHEFEVGDSISFRGTVSGHGEGITFLKRVSNLKKTIKISE